MESSLLMELDHLVVAAGSLQEGVAHVAAALGVPEDAFSPEGKHELLGTHNRLINLGGSCYLEVIAVDPAAPQPGRVRWFALDDASVQARLAERPRLLTWVARLPQATDLSALAEGRRVPPVVAMQRGSFRWRISVPGDGSLPSAAASGRLGSGSKAGSVAGGGLVPTLIQWDVPQTPADLLPPSGLTLRRLVGRHPQPEAVGGALQALGAGALISIEQQAAPEPRLVAEIETPAGLRTLV